MKLSNKILIAAYSVFILLTFITMVKLKNATSEFWKTQTIGNMKWVSLEFPLQDFNQLEVGEHFEVIWHKGSPKIKVSIEENLKSYFKAIQSNNKLDIRLDSLSNYKTNGKIVVDVYSESLNEIYLKDFVKFESLDTIRQDTLKIELLDHCDAKLILVAAYLNLDQNDFSQLMLRGNARESKIQINDHSQLNAKHLIIETAVVEMEDFSNAEVNIKARLVADCQDHSNLEYSGDSVIAEIRQKDFSEVEKKEHQ